MWSYLITKSFNWFCSGFTTLDMDYLDFTSKGSQPWKLRRQPTYNRKLQELRQEQLALPGEASVEQKPSSIIKFLQPQLRGERVRMGRLLQWYIVSKTKTLGEMNSQRWCCWWFMDPNGDVRTLSMLVPLGILFHVFASWPKTAVVFCVFFLLRFVLKALRNELHRYILYTCPNLWCNPCSKCYAMNCFGTYFSHAQTCDVTRVQSATQWTASVHTLHMPKPVM